MKYCPYCGASLVGGAASFCAECGKKIPAQTEAPQSKQSLRARWVRGSARRPSKSAEAPQPARRIRRNGKGILWISITMAIMTM